MIFPIHINFVGIPKLFSRLIPFNQKPTFLDFTTLFRLPSITRSRQLGIKRTTKYLSKNISVLFLFSFLNPTFWDFTKMICIENTFDITD